MNPEREKTMRKIDIDHAVSFTGHRPERLDMSEAVVQEWWTAHFFIQFGSRLFNEDISASDGDGMIWAAAGESEVSDYLDVLDSIDKIIVVDDVRKYGPEDIKKMYDELDSNK